MKVFVWGLFVFGGFWSKLGFEVVISVGFREYFVEFIELGLFGWLGVRGLFF